MVSKKEYLERLIEKANKLDLEDMIREEVRKGTFTQLGCSYMGDGKTKHIYSASYRDAGKIGYHLCDVSDPITAMKLALMGYDTGGTFLLYQNKRVEEIDYPRIERAEYPGAGKPVHEPAPTPKKRAARDLI
jgi:hypothetical protein